jgi:acyl-CoA thioesterase
MTLARPVASKDAILDYADQFPFFNLIGLDVVDVGPGWSEATIQYRDDLTQPAGVLHGGVIASLIDTGIAHAVLLLDGVKAVLEAGGAVVSLDLRVKYFRPVSEGALTCESTVVRAGRTVLHVESVVTNEADKEVARGDATYMVVPADKMEERA